MIYTGQIAAYVMCTYIYAEVDCQAHMKCTVCIPCIKLNFVWFPSQLSSQLGVVQSWMMPTFVNFQL